MDQCTTVGAELERVTVRCVVDTLNLVVGTITKNSSKISITTFGRIMTDSRHQWEVVAGAAVAPPVAWPVKWSKSRNKRVAGKGRQ